MNQLVVTWKNPWKKIKLEPSQYGVWIEEMLEEVIVNNATVKIEACPTGNDMNMWIRPYRYDKIKRKTFLQQFIQESFPLNVNKSRLK